MFFHPGGFVDAQPGGGDAGEVSAGGFVDAQPVAVVEAGEVSAGGFVDAQPVADHLEVRRVAGGGLIAAVR